MKNAIANIWLHPKTTASGLLLAAITVSGVLSQQGVGLGHVGSGTVLTLVTSIGTALLGLLARDPGSKAVSGTVGKLSVWILIPLLAMAPWVTGCSSVSAAEQIVHWMPALETAVATVDSTAATLAPSDAQALIAATTEFDAAANLLETQAKAYLANPSAGSLASLQNQITVFTQQVNTALLEAGKMTNSTSQQQAIHTIQSVATIAGVVLALVKSVSSKADVARMAEESPIKLAQVQALLNEDKAAELIAAHYHEQVSVARMEVIAARNMALAEGF